MTNSFADNTSPQSLCLINGAHPTTVSEFLLRATVILILVILVTLGLTPFFQKRLEKYSSARKPPGDSIVTAPSITSGQEGEANNPLRAANIVALSNIRSGAAKNIKAVANISPRAANIVALSNIRPGSAKNIKAVANISPRV